PSSPTSAQPFLARPPLAKAGIRASTGSLSFNFKAPAALLNAFAIPLFQTLSNTQLIGLRNLLAIVRHAFPIESAIVRTLLRRFFNPSLNLPNTFLLTITHGALKYTL